MTDPRPDVAERKHELLEILRHHLPPKTYFRAKELLLGLIGTPSDSPAGEARRRGPLPPGFVGSLPDFPEPDDSDVGEG